MSLSFSVLSSGSKANCTLVSSNETNILIDCGLSARQAEKRLKLLGFSMESIDALIVTHEHSDHVRGIPTLVKKFKLPIFANQKTIKRSPHILEPCASEEFLNAERFQIGGLEIEPFSISHDAADPVAFNIYANQSKLSYLCDLGQVTELVKEKIQGLNALILESNHCPDLLLEAPYPWELKQRIKSRTGHLSNLEAAELVSELASKGEQPQVIVAAHISENSNLPELALQSLRSSWSDAKKPNGQIQPEFIAASVTEATDLFVLRNGIDYESVDNNNTLEQGK